MSRIQPLFSVLLYQPFRWCYGNSPTRYRCLPKSKSVWYAVQQIANVKICWTICKFSIKYIPKFNAHSKKEIQVSLFFNLPWSLHTDQLFTEQFPLQGHSAQFPAPVDLSKAANRWCHWRNKFIFIRKWNNLAKIFTFNHTSSILLPIFQTPMRIKSTIRRNNLPRHIILLKT